MKWMGTMLNIVIFLLLFLITICALLLLFGRYIWQRNNLSIHTQFAAAQTTNKTQLYDEL